MVPNQNDKLRVVGPRGIAIIAGGATKLQAPYDDPTWLRWTMNDFYATLPKALGRTSVALSAVFEMHPPSHYNSSIIYGKDHEKRLAELSQGIDVFLAFPNPAIPKGLPYPIENVLAYFGRDYFCSTLPYMIALAIMQIESAENVLAKMLAPRIGLWGCDMQLTSEYAKERGCVEYWCGRAEERGIEVVVPDGSPLLKAPFRYGYETEKVEQTKGIINGRREEMSALVVEADRQVAFWTQSLAERRGALGELGWAEANFTEAMPKEQRPV